MCLDAEHRYRTGNLVAWFDKQRKVDSVVVDIDHDGIEYGESRGSFDTS